MKWAYYVSSTLSTVNGLTLLQTLTAYCSLVGKEKDAEHMGKLKNAHMSTRTYVSMEINGTFRDFR